MTRRSIVRTICLLVLLTVSLTSASFEIQPLHGHLANASSATSLATTASGDPTYSVIASPGRLQEGSNTTITVETLNEIANTTVTLSVTDPSGASFTKMLSITINGTGFGSNSTKYWGTFSDGANTKFVGVYTITANNITTNQILASSNFTVGLTDKPEYKRTQTVLIRAVGYFPHENVTMSLKIGNTSIAGYPKILVANNSGVLTNSWPIPSDATPGTYVIGLSSAPNQTTQTQKTPPDQDVFTVLGAVCSIRTVNLADEAVQGSVVEVYNATAETYLNLSSTTNSSGWVVFKLDQGNYTFKAFFQNAGVGALLNQNIVTDITFSIKLRLVNIVGTAETAAGEKVESIEVDLKYNYTTRANKTSTQTASMLTNATGTAEFHNLLTNVTYRVNAKRYDMLFLNTTITVPFDSSAPLLSFEMTLPDNVLNLHVLDSKDSPAAGVLVKIYEFSAVLPLRSFEINVSGNVTLSLPFGVYRLRASEDNVLLNETIVRLAEDPTEFEFKLETANLDVTVSVHDYFGRPMANAEVRIYRRSNDEYVSVANGSTGGGGVATFNSIIGGDFRVSVYIAGKLVASSMQFLASSSSTVAFSVVEYISILGFPIETGIFTVLSFAVVLVVVFLVLMRGRLMRVFRRQSSR